ncbi:MAG: ATP-binding protein [Acidimicrobiales bacterium]
MSTSELLSKPWPLTGRHEALDEVCAAIEDGCPAYFLVGEAGTGKTRLAREVLRRLAEDGWPTAGATATESARTTPLAALAHLVPSDAIDAPPQLFAATRDALAERTGGRPLVLHVDDAQHLDPSSATLLVSLAEADAVRLVITMRSGLRVPDAMVALRAADNARSTTLGSLDPMAIDTLLHRVLGGPLDGVAEAQLLEVSGGNPLYLRELVVGAVADGMPARWPGCGASRAACRRPRPWATGSSAASPRWTTRPETRWSWWPSASRSAWTCSRPWSTPWSSKSSSCAA